MFLPKSTSSINEPKGKIHGSLGITGEDAIISECGCMRVIEEVSEKTKIDPFLGTENKVENYERSYVYPQEIHT